MDDRIGAQLYTIREQCWVFEDFEKSMKKVADIGYKIVQVSGIGPIPAKNIREVCDKNGLSICCTHKGIKDYRENMPEMIEFHKTLGCSIAGLGCMPSEGYETLESLNAMIKEFNSFGDELAKHGMCFGYHNHSQEFRKIDGKLIMDYLIENTNENVVFILDTYWLAFAGIDPVKYIKKLGRRAKVVHFKDLAIYDKDAEIAEVGCGNLDWDEIIKACSENGVEYCVVEQDTCKTDPFECMKTSFDYLTKKGFN